MYQSYGCIDNIVDYNNKFLCIMYVTNKFNMIAMVLQVFSVYFP